MQTDAEMVRSRLVAEVSIRIKDAVLLHQELLTAENTAPWHWQLAWKAFLSQVMQPPLDMKLQDDAGCRICALIPGSEVLRLCDVVLSSCVLHPSELQGSTQV